ncbi:MAG: hypothetical protein HRF49_04165 [bacterium]|jgi:hypothetical protein
MDCPICFAPMEFYESLSDWTARGIREIWSDHYEYPNFSAIQLIREFGGLWHCSADFAVISAADPSVNNFDRLLRKYTDQIEQAREKIKALIKQSDSTKSAIMRIDFAKNPNLEMVTIEGKLKDLIEISIINAVEYKNTRKKYLRRDLLNQMLGITDDTPLKRGAVYLLEKREDGTSEVSKVI